MRHLSCIFAVLLLVICGSAASYASKKLSLDQGDTSVGIEVGYLVISRVRGRFEDFHGSMIIDSEYPERSHVAISINTNSVSTGDKGRDSVIRGPMLFHADRFPAMLFESDLVKMSGDGGGHIDGQLSLRDVTKPVTLNFLKVQGADRLLGDGFKVTGAIKRSDFDMNRYAGIIGNTVTLLICFNTHTCLYEDKELEAERYNP
ncbi:MAG: YceI family protein [Alphaproteobacteria bacterium]|nr:YceI family protein [Alphaproteobacteria bacterium]